MAELEVDGAFRYLARNLRPARVVEASDRSSQRLGVCRFSGLLDPPGGLVVPGLHRLHVVQVVLRRGEEGGAGQRLVDEACVGEVVGKAAPRPLADVLLPEEDWPLWARQRAEAPREPVVAGALRGVGLGAGTHEAVDHEEEGDRHVRGDPLVPCFGPPWRLGVGLPPVAIASDELIVTPGRVEWLCRRVVIAGRQRVPRRLPLVGELPDFVDVVELAEAGGAVDWDVRHPAARLRQVSPCAAGAVAFLCRRVCQVSGPCRGGRSRSRLHVRQRVGHVKAAGGEAKELVAFVAKLDAPHL